jgi:hypothetical protein
VSLALAGADPITMLGGPIPASRTALEKAGLTMADMDLYEVRVYSVCNSVPCFSMVPFIFIVPCFCYCYCFVVFVIVI